MTVYDPPEAGSQRLTVRALLDDQALGLNVRLVAGTSGLDREITHPRIQKSGLAMVGHLHGLHPNRVQVLGETEMSYAQALEPALKIEVSEHVFSAQSPCVMVMRCP